jgi:hypothetical protein
MSRCEKRSASRSAEPPGRPLRKTTLGGVFLAALLCWGCLVEPAPDYGPPEQTAPVLIHTSADPPLSQIIKVSTVGEPPLPLSILVRSEDVGEQLAASWFLNYGLAGESKDEDWLDWRIVAPSTYDDESRSVSFTWTVVRSVPAGCNQISVVVTHLLNFDDVKHKPKDATRDTDVATWWVNVDGDELAPNTLEDCPTPESLTPETDGGT